MTVTRSDSISRSPFFSLSFCLCEFLSVSLSPALLEFLLVLLQNSFYFTTPKGGSFEFMTVDILAIDRNFSFNSKTSEVAVLEALKNISVFLLVARVDSWRTYLEWNRLEMFSERVVGVVELFFWEILCLVLSQWTAECFYTFIQIIMIIILIIIM